MKILAIGTGIVGTIYGWVLSDAGHDVTHFVRPGKAAQLPRSIGVDLIDKRARYKQHIQTHYAFKTTETLSPDDGYDLILIPVKVYQLEPLLRQIGGQTGQADYLILTSLWGNLDAINALIPQERYLLGDALAGGTFRAGTLVAGLRQQIPLGEPDQKQTERLKRIAGVFDQAGIQPRLYTHILHYKWVEYATNAGLWPTLVRAGSLKRLFGNRALLRDGLTCVRECLDVCTKRGVDLSRFPESQVFLKASPVYQLILSLLIGPMFQLSAYRRRVSAHGLSDAVEIGMVYNNVLQAGQALGVPMPHYSAYQPDMRRFSDMTKRDSRATFTPAVTDAPN
jgi:2-dehydropantoate 2-reductase